MIPPLSAKKVVSAYALFVRSTLSTGTNADVILKLFIVILPVMIPPDLDNFESTYNLFVKSSSLTGT